MSDPNYIKGACEQCGSHLEFPESGIGETIDCPHCKWPTRLLVPGAPVPPPTPVAAPAPAAVPRREPSAPKPTSGTPAAKPARGNKLPIIVVLSLLVLSAVAARVWYWSREPGKASPVDASNTSTGSPARKPAIAATNPAPSPKASGKPGTNQPPATATQQPAPPKAPKSADDLKAGAVTLEKSPKNSLVYAVGTVTNASDYQRFGVRVEIEVANKKGDRIGTTSDYISVLEPRQNWQFRALIAAPKPASVKILSLKEEN